MGTFDSIYQQKILRLQEENTKLKNILTEMAQTIQRTQDLQTHISDMERAIKNNDIDPKSDHPFVKHLKNLKALHRAEQEHESVLFDTRGRPLGAFGERATRPEGVGDKLSPVEQEQDERVEHAQKRAKDTGDIVIDYRNYYGVGGR